MNRLEDILKKHTDAYHSVVPFDPAIDRLLLIDLTANNKELTEDIFINTQTFSNNINAAIQNAGAKYGIGGYNEHRTIYSRSKIFDTANTEEPRRLHLGIDIWGKPLTPVIAPLDGIIHSFAFNNEDGDYGATIILKHRLEDVGFYTLFGHLSLASIRNIHEGDYVKRGDVIAEFGIPQENGNWPPHLHFQIIKNIDGMKGDYPGVCKYSERDAFLSNCPDPDLILNMMKYVQ